MRLLPFLLAIACTPPTSDSDTSPEGTDDPVDTDVGYTGPWEVLATPAAAGAWPAVGVLGTRIHLVPSNSTDHFVYDTETDGGWATAASLPRAAHYHTGAAVGGRFYVIGGGSPGAIDSVDWNFVYDAGEDAWTEGPPVPTPRGYVTSEVVGDEIFVIGGPNVSGETWNRTVEAFDVRSGTWRTGELLPRGTMWPLYSALGVVDDRIVKLAGGIANNAFDTAYAYDVSDDAWTALTNTPVKNHGPAGATLGRSVYMIGGYVDFAVSDQVWRYDVDSDAYVAEDPLPVALAYSKAVVVGGCVYLIGGHDNAHPEVSTTFARWCPED